MVDNKHSLTGMTAGEISVLTGINERYRGKQIFDWLKKGVGSFEEMTNLPEALRRSLEKSFLIFSSKPILIETGDDNTVKIALKLKDGELIEAVLLTDENGRSTACLSSQVGCAMGCTFCRTGKMGFKRDLSSGEIIEQFMHLKILHGDINNIVYMGMGEPLMNIEAVIKSLKYFTGHDGLDISPRRITVSTCGIIKGINRLGNEALPVRLAVSLVSADSDVRTRIMPVTKTNSLPKLRDALLQYQASGGRRITLECALIRDINDTVHDAAMIAKWAEGLNVNINVIPWNPATEIDYREPDPRSLEKFCSEIERRGIPCIRRYRRGRGVNAACGQLATGLKKAGKKL